MGRKKKVTLVTGQDLRALVKATVSAIAARAEMPISGYVKSVGLASWNYNNLVNNPGAGGVDGRTQHTILKLFPGFKPAWFSRAGTRQLGFTEEGHNFLLGLIDGPAVEPVVLTTEEKPKKRVKPVVVRQNIEMPLLMGMARLIANKALITRLLPVVEHIEESGQKFSTFLRHANEQDLQG